MFRFHRLLLFCALAATCPGQMTTDQKINDFLNLSGLYAKNYAPYEWKRDVFGFDLMEAGPWLDRVRASRDDLGSTTSAWSTWRPCAAAATTVTSCPPHSPPRSASRWISMTTSC